MRLRLFLQRMTMDYFEAFALPRKLNIDTAALEQAFYARSRKLHPDRFAGKPQAEQEWATQQSSQLNDAYRTLKNGIARTEYLLTLEGVRLEEQSSAATDRARASGETKKQAIPPELLEEVFELNMQLQEMKMSREMGEQTDESTRRDLETARDDFQAKLTGLDAELRGIWGDWDANVEREDESRRAALREQMVDVLNRRNYIRNLVRDVNAALEV